MNLPSSFTGVTVETKANIYFDGGEVSHTGIMPDGAKKTLGMIRPGTYHFGTAAAERMEIVAGSCTVVVDGESEATNYVGPAGFEVTANSGFTITVADGLCEYIWSFLG